ncbi:Cu(I)-responsive transcriptional regulator [Polymorphum gilvum]|uniref:CueR-like heavy metal response, transcription regulator n=1 Tax=Polymorphum gilvum (strain LMG 25793 / CGMCC 1.9160 / SL003B-26A1) TaxID=991905 RepID=F2J500_POLGS|nr:Cu(I)-responsive transcriptional regulator [Polymorphum gilvum]ADZ70042.1 CueR-like heavy metal response, transcription regulator [Polymorphum gilvum SL003B-26A1]
MNIGDAAQETGLPAKTLRYYEDIGLVRPLRQENGYRYYSARDVDRLRFLKRARGLGFSIEDCRSLLQFQEDPTRASADVKRVAEAHIRTLDSKIEELLDLRRTLGDMVATCRGDADPDCAILQGLAADE